MGDEVVQQRRYFAQGLNEEQRQQVKLAVFLALLWQDFPEAEITKHVTTKFGAHYLELCVGLSADFAQQQQITQVIALTKFVQWQNNVPKT